MTSPLPGITYPSPRTWSDDDDITTPRLRSDLYDMAAIFTTARPLFISGDLIGGLVASASTVSPLDIGAAQINTWQVPCLTNPPQPYYIVPLAGWYLCEGGVQQGGGGGTQQQSTFGQGIQAIQNSVTLNSCGAFLPETTDASQTVQGVAADLLEFNEADQAALFAYYTPSYGVSDVIASTLFKVEWVAMPTSGLANYTGPTGTVVASPQLAAPWPPGPGTYITQSGGIAAGATSVEVASAAGIVVNGWLGLDVAGGQRYQPVAEAVQVTSVAGTTIGIDACAYAHAQDAPVAVPVSAAWLNQQDRDLVNFLAYPPVYRAEPQSTQSMASNGLTSPVASQQVTGFTSTADNFSGGSSSGYTVQVGGVYYVYGQVFYAGSTATTVYSAGVSVNGGAVQWGTTFRSATSSAAAQMCATFCRHLRLAAGQTVTLWGSQTSGSNMNTVVASSPHRNSRLILIWRGL